MKSTSTRTKLALGLADFESRHLQVAAEAEVGIPLQIRTIREARSWNQTELAEKIGTTQNAISRLESDRYGKPNLKTLLRLAKAFDVALLVKFVPFSKFVGAVDEMSSTSVVVPCYEKDKELQEMISAPMDLPGGLNRTLDNVIQFPGRIYPEEQLVTTCPHECRPDPRPRIQPQSETSASTAAVVQ